MALLFWLLLLGGYQWYALSNYLSPLDVLQQAITVPKSNMFGVLLFIRRVSLVFTWFVV